MRERKKEKWIVVCLFSTDRGGEIESVNLVEDSARVWRSLFHPEEMLDPDDADAWKEGEIFLDRVIVKNVESGWQHTVDGSEAVWIGENTAFTFRKQGLPATSTV